MKEMSADAGLCLLEKPYLWEYVNPSALFLLLVKYNAILNSDGRRMKTDLRLACCLCGNILSHFECPTLFCAIQMLGHVIHTNGT